MGRGKVHLWAADVEAFLKSAGGMPPDGRIVSVTARNDPESVSFLIEAESLPELEARECGAPYIPARVVHVETITVDGKDYERRYFED